MKNYKQNKTGIYIAQGVVVFSVIGLLSLPAIRYYMNETSKTSTTQVLTPQNTNNSRLELKLKLTPELTKCTTSFGPVYCRVESSKRLGPKIEKLTFYTQGH